MDGSLVSVPDLSSHRERADVLGTPAWRQRHREPQLLDPAQCAECVPRRAAAGLSALWPGEVHARVEAHATRTCGVPCRTGVCVCSLPHQSPAAEPGANGLLVATVVARV